MKLKDVLSVVFYTNEKYFPIAELAISEFNKFSKNINIEKYLITNKTQKDYCPNILDFKLLDTNVEFRSDASHFSEVLINGLKKIKTEYVLFFLEDYFLMRDIKKSNLKKLMNVILYNNIDHFSFMSYDYEDWETLDLNYDQVGLPKNSILEIKDSYLYKYSAQPCIWKVSSLIELLENNPNLTVSQLDVTDIKNKKGEKRHGNSEGFWNTPIDFWDYDFKSYCLRKMHQTNYYAFDTHNGKDDYLFFQYAEVIRFGKFNFKTHRNNRDYVINFLNEKNINKDNLKYKNFFYED